MAHQGGFGVGEVQTTQPKIDDVGGTKVRSHQAGIGVRQAEEVPNLMGGNGADDVIMAAAVPIPPASRVA